ncbi:hypothetical protein EPIR_3198 [Erwinia piriflorinigrans CFBP 5888]|uniref:Uncharacterized protein n=1 Tax=Erwinia piriflorinigrans CFBP 5888 TaxID=1161919 RepID=V5ZCA9_9GAMM|nr:hypothetical protein EPIR_3198 [Erwinia piriflorinigrans CFBP 5888]
MHSGYLSFVGDTLSCRFGTPDLLEVISTRSLSLMVQSDMMIIIVDLWPDNVLLRLVT